MRTKQFDCVDMMHRAATRVYEATKSLSREQELEYWDQRATQLLRDRRADDAPAARGKRRIRESTK